MHKRIQVVVVGAIKHNGKYLLTKRYNPRYKFTHNKWQFPGGGLEFNETVLECLHREVKEETGIEIQVIEQIPFIHEKILAKEAWHGVAVSFLCKPILNDPKVVINREASSFHWYTYEQALELDLHHGTTDVIHEAERVSGQGES